MRTEAQFYEDHLGAVVDNLYDRIEVLESKGTMDDQDEMELAALDKLIRDLEEL